MIIVSPLHELQAALTTGRPSHVISLASPGADPAPLPATAEVLQLTFHDIVEPRGELVMAAASDVEALLAFARSWGGSRPLLVHCWAGVSRSPAAAYAIACAASRPGTEALIAASLREAAPFATPNRHVVALADTLLTRHGAMSAAIASIGRGADTNMGSTFCIPVNGYHE